MTNRDRAAFACYLVPALTLLAFGIRYLTSSEFMPYHAAALGREWSDLLPNEKGVMLAALRGGGGGFVIGGVSILLLLLMPFRRGELWAHRAAPALVLLCGLSALFTSATLARLTPGSPPWPLALIMVGLALVGFVSSPGRAPSAQLTDKTLQPTSGAPAPLKRGMSTSYEGRCHCGALGFSYTTDLPPDAWPVRACQCAFCRAHGAVCTSDPNGSVHFRIAKASALVRYSFALRTAEFLLCGICGVYLGAVLASDRGAFATVNLSTLTQPIPELSPPRPAFYDSESREQRVARRERRWTPVAGQI